MPFDPSAWGSTPATSNEYDDWKPEPGDYEVAVDNVETFEAKGSGLPFLRTTYQMQGGPNNGRTWAEIGALSGEWVGITKGHLALLGVELTGPDGTDATMTEQLLDERLAAVKGRYFRVRVVRNRKGYVNTRVEGAAGPVQSDTPPPDAGDLQVPRTTTVGGQATDTSDIPFLWDGPVDFSDRYHSNR